MEEESAGVKAETAFVEPAGGKQVVMVEAPKLVQVTLVDETETVGYRQKYGACSVVGDVTVRRTTKLATMERW